MGMIVDTIDSNKVHKIVKNALIVWALSAANHYGVKTYL